MPNGLNCEERRSGLADDGAIIFDNRMAGSEAKPTPERPTDDACERRVVAEPVWKLSFGSEGEVAGRSIKLDASRVR